MEQAHARGQRRLAGSVTTGGHPSDAASPVGEDSYIEREAQQLAATAPSELAVDLASSRVTNWLSAEQIACGRTWLGADLSGVRVVTGARGHETASRFGASALTVGNEIFVSRGRLGAAAPSLAHEIAHVAQQRRNPMAGPVQQRLAVGRVARQRLVPDVAVVGTDVRSAVLLNGAPLVDCRGPLHDITVSKQVQGIAAWLHIEVRVSPRVQAVVSPGAEEVLASAADGYVLVVVIDPPPGLAGGEETPIARMAGGTQPTTAIVVPVPLSPKAGTPQLPTRVQRLQRALVDGASDADSIAAELTEEELSGLDLDTRMQALRQIAHGWVVGNEDEATLIRLIRRTPPSQSDAVLAELGSNHAKLLQRLETVIDFSDYRRYHLALRDLSTQTLAAKPGIDVQNTIQNAPVFPWSDTGLIKSMTNARVYYDDVRFTDSGKITFSFYVSIWGLGLKHGPFTLDPLQIIGVKFFVDETHEGAGAGETRYMPAINLLELINKQTWQEYQLIGEVAMLASGVGGVVGATTKLRRAVALVDMAVGAMGIVLVDYRAEIGKSPTGQRFLAQWDRFVAVYAIVGGLRMVRELPTAFKTLKNSWNGFRASAGGKLSAESAAQMDKQVAALEQRLAQAVEDAEGAPNETFSSQGKAPNAGSASKNTSNTSASSTAETGDYKTLPFKRLEELAARTDKKAIDELVRRNSLRMVEPEPSAAVKADMTYAELQSLERENAWAAAELSARTERLGTSLKQFRAEQSTTIVPGTLRPVGQRGAVGTLQSGSQTVGGTLAVAETDIPHLSKGFRGASPEAGGPKLSQQGKESPFSPDNLDPRGRGHAEERTLASIDQEIETGKKTGTLSNADLEGRTVRLHVEDLPCSSCTAGIGHSHSSGPLVKFLDKYPGMRLVVTDAFSGQTLIMSKAADGSVLVLRQGIRTF